MIYIMIFKKDLKTKAGKTNVNTVFIMQYFDDIKGNFQRIINSINDQIMKFLEKRRTQE